MAARATTSTPHPKGESGFTLIEVLVSLAIFSLAIVGLQRAASFAALGTSNLQAAVHGGFVADNAIVRTRLRALETGVERYEERSGGQVFNVVVETSETELENFYRIDVRISRVDAERIVASRRGFRAVIEDRVVDTANDETQP